MRQLFPDSWTEQMKGEMEKPYFAELSRFVADEYETGRCFPPKTEIFNAFRLCPFKETKVVIIGQDPYHEQNQAHGLAFSVPQGIKMPPSLRNIFKELANDLGSSVSTDSDLSRWASQGVLLLNATLTVREGHANAHAGHGWETFTDAVIRRISEELPHVVFLLWGNYAQKKAELIDKERHLVLLSAHPSPLSAWHGFFGNHHFSQANAFLISNGLTPINW